MRQGHGFGLNCIQALSSLESLDPFYITFSRDLVFQAVFINGLYV